MDKYIGLDLAIAALCRQITANTSPAQREMLRRAAIEMRSLAAAADVAPVVHGRWEPVDEPPCGGWRCSACGDSSVFVWDMSADEMCEYYPYCHHCGARMDGGAEDG